jgi:hypothetical protein
VRHTANFDITGDAAVNSIVDTWTYGPLNGL